MGPWNLRNEKYCGKWGVPPHVEVLAGRQGDNKKIDLRGSSPKMTQLNGGIVPSTFQYLLEVGIIYQGPTDSKRAQSGPVFLWRVHLLGAICGPFNFWRVILGVASK